MGRAARPDQAVDPRGGGHQKLAQQVDTEESRRPGEEDRARSPPVRRRARAQAHGMGQFRLAAEVDPRIHAIGGGPPRAGVPRGIREAPQRRVPEQAAGERTDVARADSEHDARAGQHLGRQQGVAAKCEEIVVETHPRCPEHRGPQMRHPGLYRVVVCLRAAGRDHGIGECLPVDSPFRGQRHLVQRDERGGNHEARNASRQKAPQARARRQIVRPVGPVRLATAARVVRLELGVTWAELACHDRRLADTRVSGEGTLDLGGLDAEAAHLHLAVHPPDDLQIFALAILVFSILVFTPAPEISAAVHPATWDVTVRVGQEQLCRKSRLAKIAPGDTAAADVDLPHRSRGCWVQVRVENEDLGMRERPAHRYHRGRYLRFPGHVEQGRRDRRLGQPVGVYQSGRARRPHGRTAVRGVRRVTAGDHEPNAAQPLIAGFGDREQLVPVRGRQIDDGHPLLSQIAEQVGRRDRPRVRQHQGRAAVQRHQYLLYRRVKAEGSQLQDPVLRGDPVLAGYFPDEACQ